MTYTITDASQGWPVAIAASKEEARNWVEKYNGECCVWDENNNDAFEEIFTDDVVRIECHLWKEYETSSVWICTPVNLDMDKYWYVYGDYTGFTKKDAIINFRKRLEKCKIEAEINTTVVNFSYH